jgi:hypothetical protein
LPDPESWNDQVAHAMFHRNSGRATNTSISSNIQHANISYPCSLLKLALNQMAVTCSDVTKIDGSDVQQMSQMADLNGSDSVSMSPPLPPSSRSLVSVIKCGILGI